MDNKMQEYVHKIALHIISYGSDGKVKDLEGITAKDLDQLYLDNGKFRGVVQKALSKCMLEVYENGGYLRVEVFDREKRDKEGSMSINDDANHLSLIIVQGKKYLGVFHPDAVTPWVTQSMQIEAMNAEAVSDWFWCRHLGKLDTMKIYYNKSSTKAFTVRDLDRKEKEWIESGKKILKKATDGRAIRRLEADWFETKFKKQWCK